MNAIMNMMIAVTMFIATPALTTTIRFPIETLE